MNEWYLACLPCPVEAQICFCLLRTAAAAVYIVLFLYEHWPCIITLSWEGYLVWQGAFRSCLLKGGAKRSTCLSVLSSVSLMPLPFCERRMNGTRKLNGAAELARGFWTWTDCAIGYFWIVDRGMSEWVIRKGAEWQWDVDKDTEFCTVKGRQLMLWLVSV